MTLRIEAPELRLALLSAIAGWALGIALLLVPAWNPVELKAFDLFSVYRAPLAATQPIVLVGIDEETLIQLNQSWPLPRALHAKLIDKLVDAGAAVIAFDVPLSERVTAAGDQALAASIANAGNVVLASSLEFHDTAVARVRKRMDPLLDFSMAGATIGLTDLELDADLVPRMMAQQADAFWLQAIRALIRGDPDAGIAEPRIPSQAMIRYLGPRETFPYVSYYQIIVGDEAIPPDYFAGVMVLIGRVSGDSATIRADLL